MADIKKSLVTPDQSIQVAMATIEGSPGKIALVVDVNGRLLGTVTDGDIRRALLKRIGLNEPVSEAMNPAPHTAGPNDRSEDILALMRRDKLRHMPIVDAAGNVIGLETLEECLEFARRDNWVVIMAGGEGRRLRPLTNDVPKPMLPIGKKPILETIIDNFVDCGFGRFFLSVNYRAEQIEQYFGDGSNRGIRIEYLRERNAMGTAGSLSLLPERPSQPIVVMNGDILTNVKFHEILNFHQEHGAIGTMCVREYRFQVPYGVVSADGQYLTGIREKPEGVELVSAGIYVLDPAALDYIPKGEPIQMPALFEQIIENKRQCAIFPIREYWLDIGRHADLQQAQDDFTSL